MARTLSQPTLDELVDRARRLGAAAERRLLGITGPPGAGKSTLAGVIAEKVGAVVVSMDGYHLPAEQLQSLNLLERRGAPATFDADGFVAMLRQVRTARTPVRVPGFDRSREQTVSDAVTVPAHAVLVVVEGNYLLLDIAPWRDIRALLDQVWFLDHPRRVERLVQRHVKYGRARDSAHARATTGSDGDNARLVIASQHRADLVLTHGWLGG